MAVFLPSRCLTDGFLIFQGRRRNFLVDNTEVNQWRLCRGESDDDRENAINVIIIIITVIVITVINIISIETNESGREKRLPRIRRRKTCFFNRINDNNIDVKGAGHDTKDGRMRSVRHKPSDE